MTRNLWVWVPVTVAVMLLLVFLSFLVLYQMGGRIYFIEKTESVVKTEIGKIYLAECSDGKVLKKIPSGWRCEEDTDGNVIGGGWEKDYDKSCSACNTCGIFWGSATCTSTVGESASFQCSEGQKLKVAEYGAIEQKTYWYQCIN